MCGICGAAWLDPSHALPYDHLRRMTDALTHRGPDDQGHYTDDHAALGFRRLSIIDLAGAHQPLANEDQSVWVVFNGEIYNFPALRHRLEARGHSLKSKGDTEVLVHLYEDEGPGLFPLLRGMFALAIWDAPRRTLLLGRDRLGQKPLLYHLTPQSLTFASELKALLTLPPDRLPRQINLRSLDQYLTYGYIPHPESIFQTIAKLPPAHYALWHEGRFSIHPYWQPDPNLVTHQSFDQSREQLQALLTDAVREQMIADVPLGAFLSGGIDSTIIVGLMKRVSNAPVRTFSIGFTDPAFDESRYAAEAAAFLHTDHHPFHVEPHAWDTLPALARQFDEPFADSSALPTWYLAEQTRQHVTVALSGDAGDELFAGYDRYRALALSAATDTLPVNFRRFLAHSVAPAIPASARAKTRLRRVKRLLEPLADPPLVRYLRWITLFDESARSALYSDHLLDQLVRADQYAEQGGDPLALFRSAWDSAPKRDLVTRASLADLRLYLPCDLLVKVDLASMAHSLECRSPFLDHRVVECALALPIDHKLNPWSGQSKRILKSAFHDLLPPAIQNRPKMGFGVPLDRWFRESLLNPLRDILLDPRTLNRNYFQPPEITRLIDEHAAAQADHAYKLWALLILELWFRAYGDP